MTEEFRYEKAGKVLSVELEYLPQAGWTIMFTASDGPMVVCLPIRLEAAELLFKGLQKLVGRERATVDYAGDHESALVIGLEYREDVGIGLEDTENVGWGIYLTAHAGKQDILPKGRVGFALSLETAEALACQATLLVGAGYEQRREDAAEQVQIV
jgi:hypothetical protein